MNFEISEEEVKAVLHCLTRTNSRNTVLPGNTLGALDLIEKVEQRLLNLINKPISTTKEKVLDRTKVFTNLPNKTIEDLENFADDILDIAEGKFKK